MSPTPSAYGSIGEVEPLIERRSDSSLTRVSTLSGSTSHSERHSDNGDLIRDVIIGFADGLTVPFALTAGLSSLGDTRLVVMGGLAELFSGAISMGLGAYLAASTEKEHYESEEKRERDEVERMPDEERQEIYDILAQYHISQEASAPLVNELCKNPEMWVRFMMDFELRLEKPKTSRAWLSAVTMGMSYFIGGLIPMIPYFLMETAMRALMVSICITVVILLIFGYIKTAITVHNKVAGCWGALQTLVIGALAAGAAYGIVRALDSGH
ncbi:vacuolar iron transporter [Grosmannia clavigera kw1407]|uniref:Vacuolar iron transporter n=1 Tax=Grosmannia clavigera (strain kw1407 / UAMH 11150) TaxID=655863 RepID=F0X717_GROCL|nr:vacuolar iron transporter [Grosmannia clavigera kw1407]EFX06521.1 vacuolar iron transporter [Grosmannia clavigera kw1407]